MTWKTNYVYMTRKKEEKKRRKERKKERRKEEKKKKRKKERGKDVQREILCGCWNWMFLCPFPRLDWVV